MNEEKKDEKEKEKEKEKKEVKESHFRLPITVRCRHCGKEFTILL